MAIVEDKLNDDEFFVDAVNTPKKGIATQKTRRIKACHRQGQARG